MEFTLFPIWFLTVAAFITGCGLGSFFNVVIYRMPRGESLMWPGSHCPACSGKIAFYDNVPVLSWLLLSGKCRKCKAAISVQYPLVELLTGALTAAGFYILYSYCQTIPLSIKAGILYLVLVSVPIIIIDIRHYLIPDALVLPGILLGIGLSFLEGAITPLQSLYGGLGAGFVLWLLGWVTSMIYHKEALGFGDIKLIAMGGSLFGLPAGALGLMFASLIGCLVYIPLMLLAKHKRESYIPFGPFICAGLLISSIWGQRLLDLYISLVLA